MEHKQERNVAVATILDDTLNEINLLSSVSMSKDHELYASVPIFLHGFKCAKPQSLQ